jgi:phosphoglucomutase
MEAAIQEKINAWLNGNYDEATKTAITKLQKENPMNWRMLFIRI